MKIRISFSKSVGITLFLIGIASIFAAIIYASAILAMAGLGFVFWGVILTYIQPDVYVRKTILDATSITLITSLNETLTALDYTGRAVYLPPKYLNEPESSKVYVQKNGTAILPTPEATQKLETQSTHTNALGTLITPPGADLAKLLETSLKSKFIRTNLETLRERLPKMLIEDLEIVTNCEIQLSTKESNEETPESGQADQNTILVRFSTTAYKDICKRATQLSAIFQNVGCPLSSALAIGFAKATGKPIAIKAQSTSENGETNETQFIVLEEQTP